MAVVQRARIPGSDRLIWLVVGEDHLPVESIRRYLAYLDDVQRSPNTLRAYAHHLKLFWDYLDWAKLAWTDVGCHVSSNSPTNVQRIPHGWWR